MRNAIKRAFSHFPIRQDMVLALAAGVATALGQAPWSLWPVAIMGLSVICWLILKAPNWANAAWIGWLSGTSYFAVALFWIVEPFLVDIARHGWMAPFALLFMSSGLALLWALAMGISGVFKPLFLRSIAVVVLLTLSEMLRSILFTGFPWALIGYIWSEHPILQLAAYVGPYGLVAFSLIISVLFAVSVLKKSLLAVLSGAVIFGAAWGNGHLTLNSADGVTTEKTVRMVQPNAAQHLKWQAEMIPQFFNAQLEMTAGAKEAGVNLVIWPETSVGYRLNSTPEALEWIKQTAGGVPVVFGGNSFLDGKVRNTMAFMGPDGTVDDWYYKHHLVPFGEYIPGGELLRGWGIRGLAAQDGAGYAAGDGPQLIDIAGIGSVLPLICYEMIFPRHLRTETRPELILQITNDAWFGKISGPYQHLAQAKFRAVEQGLPLVRVANTGVSAMIDPLGRVTAQIPVGEAGFLDAAIPSRKSPTLYSKTGDTPLLLFLFMVLAGLFVARGLGRGHD